jgi:hypothetical protein
MARTRQLGLPDHVAGGAPIERDIGFEAGAVEPRPTPTGPVLGRCTECNEEKDKQYRRLCNGDCIKTQNHSRPQITGDRAAVPENRNEPRIELILLDKRHGELFHQFPGLWHMFNTDSLFASLIWGSVGVGYFIYGKKQRSWLPMLGGALMIAASYFASALMMSLICTGLMVAIYMLLKRGY